MYEEVSKQVLTDNWPIGIWISFPGRVNSVKYGANFPWSDKDICPKPRGSKLGMYENHLRGRLIYGITAQMREINEDISYKYYTTHNGVKC